MVVGWCLFQWWKGVDGALCQRMTVVDSTHCKIADHIVSIVALRNLDGAFLFNLHLQCR